MCALSINYNAEVAFIPYSMVSCQKGPIRHAYTWQIGPFWQDILDYVTVRYSSGLSRKWYGTYGGFGSNIFIYAQFE